jgi:predicted nucleic acid-binding protein
MVMAQRRGRLTASQVATVAADLEDFMQVVEVESLAVRATVLIATARRTFLTVYDAAYLELASRRRLPLATLDDKLWQAARRAGLELI